jgi:hypothetical protein
MVADTNTTNARSLPKAARYIFFRRKQLQREVLDCRGAQSRLGMLSATEPLERFTSRWSHAWKSTRITIYLPPRTSPTIL